MVAPASASSKLKPRIVVLEVITVPARKIQRGLNLVLNYGESEFAATHPNSGSCTQNAQLDSAASRVSRMHREHRIDHRRTDRHLRFELKRRLDLKRRPAQAGPLSF
jgi:hypothetical protein